MRAARCQRPDNGHADRQRKPGQAMNPVCKTPQQGKSQTALWRGFPTTASTATPGRLPVGNDHAAAGRSLRGAL